MKKLFSRASILTLTLIMISSLQGCTKEPKKEEVKKDVLWSFKTGGPIQSSPVIYENDIIFGSSDKSIYSVDLSSQEEKWKFESDGIVNSTPIIDGNNVVVSSQSTCYLLDAKTGNEIWKYEVGGDTAQIDVYDYHSASPIVYKDLVIFTSKNGTIYGINKGDGKLKWKYLAEGSREVRTTPAIQDNIMVFGDIKGNCYAMDLETQKTVWTKRLGVDYIHQAFAYKDYAYFMGRDCKLVAYDLKDGTEKWSYDDPIGSWLTAEIIAKDDVLYVGGSDNFKVLTFKYDSGERDKTYSTIANVFSKPLIDNNIMYVTDGNAYTKTSGQLMAYDLSNGTEKIWSTKLGTAIFSSPVLKDGIIYFGGVDGNLYAVEI